MRALEKEPELRYTANGKAVVNFSVASDSGYGENKNTEWFSVVAWDKAAEACAKYLDKGSLVYVEGRLQTRSWDKDGTKQYRTELVAQEVKFLDSKTMKSEPEVDLVQDALPF